MSGPSTEAGGLPRWPTLTLQEAQLLADLHRKVHGIVTSTRDQNAYERGLGEGIDLVIELVRRHITPEQRHAVEQDIARFLAHPAAEARRELLARRDEDDHAQEEPHGT